MQELRQEASIRSKAKSKVGTIQAESLNYNKDIPAFDKSHIAPRAAGIKSEVKVSVMKDILGTKKIPWNPTVLLDRTKEYHEQISTSQLHFEIRKGIRDVSLPLPTQNKIYEGVDTRNNYLGWNTSVQFNPLDHKKKYLVVNNEARHKSAIKNREILKDKEYIKPYDRQIQILEKSREIKTQDRSLKHKILEKIVHDNPDISHEKTAAAVFKQVAESKLKDIQQKFYGVKEESFEPDVSKTIKRRSVKKFKHDGCFQFNQALNKEIWSCCANENKDSKGCVVTYKDPDKWQTISF